MGSRSDEKKTFTRDDNLQLSFAKALRSHRPSGINDVRSILAALDSRYVLQKIVIHQQVPEANDAVIKTDSRGKNEDKSSENEDWELL